MTKQETTNDVIEALDDLIETLEDGVLGFKHAASRAANDGRQDIAFIFERLAIQRQHFLSELTSISDEMGHDWKESGSVAGALHRGWMNVADVVTGGSPNVLLDAAETGETHTVTAYEQALSKKLPSSLLDTVQHQLSEVLKAREEVRSISRKV
jgi:uncharacterized protein (TIGR02284 family)